MSGANSTIIATYRKWLYIFIGVHVAIAWSILTLGSFDIKSVNSVWEIIQKKDGLVWALIPIITLVLNGMLSSRFKAILVFWRFKHPLPGCRVFSDLAANDHRIDLSAIRNSHGLIPDLPEEQNRLWYKIYKKHENNSVVIDSHKSYLFSRDLAGVSFFLIFVGAILAVFAKVPTIVKTVYGLCLVLQYLAFAIASRNYGNRFVCNVLAQESASG